MAIQEVLANTRQTLFNEFEQRLRHSVLLTKIIIGEKLCNLIFCHLSRLKRPSNSSRSTAPTFRD